MVNKTDEKIQELVINKLTTQQYDAAKEAGSLSETELYYITDGGISVNQISGLAEVAKTNDYTDLNNKPVIGTGNLVIQKNGSQVAVFDANSTSNVTANITVPTVSDTYSSSSSNAMSGIAVASALQTVDAMKNTATGTNSLTILGTPTAASNATNIGPDTTATGSNAIALGKGAHANHNNSIQIGPGTSFTTDELNVGFGNENYTLLDGNTGLIPDDRISTNIARTSALADKQDTLIAGRNIIIEDNVISATSGGQGGSVDSVNGDIGDVIVKAVQNQKDNSTMLKTWVGTKAEYDAIPVKDNQTIYYIEKSGSPVDIYQELDNKQDKLTAGTGINISAQNVISSTATVTVDSSLSTTSENPVQNKIITGALNNKQDTISDLSSIRSDASAGASAATTISGYGNIVTHDVSEFQETLIAGTNITIAADGKTISATGAVTSVNSDTGAVVIKSIQNDADNSTMLKTWVGSKSDYEEISIKDPNTIYYVQEPGEPIDIYEELEKKQNTLIAGTNITLTENADDTVTISASGGGGGTTYTAGNGIDIDTTTDTISIDTSVVATQSDLPTAVSELTNDAGYITSIPTASSNTLGGIKVGTNLTIDANGVLSADIQPDAVNSVNGDTGTVIVKAVQNNADNSSMLKTWVGTQAAYDAIQEKDPNTLYYVKKPGSSVDIYEELDNKQDKLTAGSGITISAQNVISATGAVESVNGDTGVVVVDSIQNVNDQTAMLQLWVGSEEDYEAISVKDDNTLYYVQKEGEPVDIYQELENKQDKLTAGTNITISDNTISATDTTYSAGTGIDITNNTISVTSPVLQNTATSNTSINIGGQVTPATYSVSIGNDSFTPNAPQASCVVIGNNAGANTNAPYSVTIGSNAVASNRNGIIIGSAAQTRADFAVQIGGGAVNSGANSFNFGPANNTESNSVYFSRYNDYPNAWTTDKYKLLDLTTGKIPNDRLNLDSMPTSASTNGITSDAVYTALNNYQTTANLVTSVSAESTDSQYVSAKCVYDLMGDLESLLHDINFGESADDYSE